MYKIHMTAIKSEEGSNTPSIAAKIISANLNIFAIELKGWTVSTVKQGVTACALGSSNAIKLVEKAKKAVVSPMLPRNSAIGRPFSPLGVGGLSAVIGLSGALFGHNGVIRPQANIASIIPDNNQIVLAGSVLSSDIMIDSAKLGTVIPEGRTREEVLVHKVESGETLESIAKDYKVTVDSIKYVNDMQDEDTIKPAQELTILPVTGVLHEVKSGDTVESIAAKWKVPAQAIVDINWLDEPYEVHDGQKLVIPNAEIPKPIEPQRSQPASGLAVRPQPQQSQGPAPASGKFVFPTSGQITQYFSYYHNGLDIGTMNDNRPIWSADSGIVTFAGWWNGGGGYSVWVDHGNGYVTQYAHMSQIHVSVGQRVGRGQQLGLTGNTGLSFGNHLHFNVLLNGKLVNPLSVL
jgi:murein DD-endopeptidase MepM/ murein hydrolase activator NlpD